MKYTLTIDQRAIVVGGFDLDIVEAAIMHQCRWFSASPKCQFKIDHNRLWYWFQHKNVCEQLPILRMKPDSVYRRMKALCEKGFLLAHPANKQTNSSWYAFGELVDALEAAENTIGRKSEPSEQNPKATPQTIGSKSEPSEIHPNPSEQNPNTIGELSEGPSDENPMYTYITLEEHKENSINKNAAPPNFSAATAPDPGRAVGEGELKETPSMNPPPAKKETGGREVTKSEHGLTYRIYQQLDAAAPGLPWGAKEAAAAKQIGERIRATLEKQNRAAADDDVLTSLAYFIEQTYTLPQFFHFTDICQLNNKFGAIYQQLIDRIKRGNANPTTANNRPVAPAHYTPEQKRQRVADVFGAIDSLADSRASGGGIRLPGSK